MTNKIGKFLSVFMFALIAAAMFAPAANALQRFEDENVSITTKLPPQYTGWAVVVGDTITQNVSWYYKVSAVLPGITETVTGSTAHAYSKYGPLSSTNSIRAIWAAVPGATSYKLYKSVDNTSFYLLYSGTALTYVDEGASLGAAYSAPSPRGGNLTVENDVAIGDDLTVAGDLTVSGTLSPWTTGTLTTTGDFHTTGNVGIGNTAPTVALDVTGAALVSTTLGVTGATSLTSNLTVLGNSYLGAVSYKSTNTASTGGWVMPATLNVIGAVTLDSTLDVDGNEYHGATAYRSTFTASSGAQAWTGNLSTLGGITGVALNATGAVTLDSTLDVDGNEYHGATAYRSTFTASTGAQIWTGAISSLASATAPTITGSTLVTGAKVTASAGPFTMYSRTAAQIIVIDPTVEGEFYYCSDCTTVAVCVSTGTAAYDWALFTDKTAACE